MLFRSRALHKMPHDGSEPHITVKSPAWWRDVFTELGFKSIVRLSSSQSSVIIYANREKDNDEDLLPRCNLFLQQREIVQSGGAYIEVQGGG